MYRHCLFCQTDLGSNDVVESLPIGRRLAFDEAKGRLWVVCRKCERWNLTPFDTRFEAIEACEREFRSTRMRVSTDNIGLARVSEGLELVRIGQPMRPEMAAWRYGDQFGRRYRRHVALSGLITGAGWMSYVGFTPIALGAGVVAVSIARARDYVNRTAIRTDDGRRVWVYPRYAKKARIRFDTVGGRIVFSVPAGDTTEWWYGDDARLAAAHVMPRANLDGASKGDVRRAVEFLSTMKLLDDPLGSVLGRSRRNAGEALDVSVLSPAQRLALEMALHEGEERRALEGELAVLEERWRAAEEIAGIADSLAIPDSVERELARLKAGK